MARREARKGATRLSTRLSRRRATRSKTTPRSPRASRKSTPAPARLVSLPPGLSVDEPFSIPTGYGDTRVVLMVKDPWWLYAYWEVQPQTERAIRGQLLPEEVPGLQSILRVYDVTDRGASCEAAQAFDISLSGLAKNWYIETTTPGRSFIVEIGLLAHTGRFLPFARSNRVTTPRAAPSEVVDAAWPVTDETFVKLFGISAGIGGRRDTSAWRARVQQQLASGRWLATAPKRATPAKGLWFRAETDLAFYGATEPKSMVTFQGQPVAVRKDGTFSLRLTLPEGTQTVAMEVTSPDGTTTRTFTQTVTLGRSSAFIPETAVHQSPHQIDPRGIGQGNA